MSITYIVVGACWNVQVHMKFSKTFDVILPQNQYEATNPDVSPLVCFVLVDPI